LTPIIVIKCEFCDLTIVIKCGFCETSTVIIKYGFCVKIVILESINLLKPTGYMMHQQV